MQSIVKPKIKAKENKKQYLYESTPPQGSIPRNCAKFFQEFAEMREIARKASMIKYILNKIADMLLPLLDSVYTTYFL